MKTIQVVAAVIRRDGLIFATQRGYGDYKDWWEFPGGKIEEGESPQEALAREIREELDTEIEVGGYLTTVEHDYPEFHLSMRCYFCTVREGSLILKEHEASRWLKPEELDSVAWLPADVKVVEALRKSPEAGKRQPAAVYPRPQLRRGRWKSLDGKWLLNGSPVTVPSALCAQNTPLRYEKDFSVPEEWRGSRVLLHIGAADQTACVCVNGRFAGEHAGGYTAFTVDITEHLLWDDAAPAQEKAGGASEPNHLCVQVTDTFSRDYPYGKQSLKPGGMWYPQVSGIWQSVWIEPVPERYIAEISLVPDLTGVDIAVHLQPGAAGADPPAVSARFAWIKPPEGGEAAPEGRMDLPAGSSLTFSRWVTFPGLSGRLSVADTPGENNESFMPRCWTPEEPDLYALEIRCGEDFVESYFALRTIEIGRCPEENGQSLLLNGKRVFLHGVLDQGYFADGFYLPVKDGNYAPEAYAQDILRMKALGFNFLRKHIKVEPEAYYYACDRLGMLVMQDMVSSGPYHYVRETALPNLGLTKRREKKRIPADYRQEMFIRSLKETIRQLKNHPGIIAWTIFNEGWGQFDSDRLYDLVKELDPTRPVDSTSGWFAQKRSDFDSRHVYFVDRRLKPGKRPMLLSECGGFGLAVQGHVREGTKKLGYGACSSSANLTERIIRMYEKMVLPAIPEGLCGAVYTQLSDVEGEINGLYTYDRQVLKVLPEQMRELAARLRAAAETQQELT